MRNRIVIQSLCTVTLLAAIAGLSGCSAEVSTDGGDGSGAAAGKSLFADPTDPSKAAASPKQQALKLSPDMTSNFNEITIPNATDAHPSYEFTFAPAADFDLRVRNLPYGNYLGANGKFCQSDDISWSFAWFETGADYQASGLGQPVTSDDYIPAYRGRHYVLRASLTIPSNCKAMNLEFGATQQALSATSAY